MSTLRLTFRVVGGALRLVSQERLDMLCPPQVGERPQAGRHSGYWVELRRDDGEIAFHRLLHNPMRTSVEVPTPSGLRRVFGPPPEDALFEVLVPDDPAATTIVLMGDDPAAGGPALAVAPTGAQEIARFDLHAQDGTA